MNRKPFEITEIRDEATNVKTFLLDKSMEAEPGQYIMLWLPWDGLEKTGSEKPFSISYTEPLGITVKKVGPFTEALFEKEEGDKVFVRGPLGKGFKANDFNLTDLHIIGGGTGIVSLALLGEYIREKTIGSNITSFLGANSIDELIFEERLKEVGEVYISTIDGSKGEKGLVTDLFKEYEFPKGSKTVVCGPEKMIYNSVKILEKRIEPKNIYLSLERLMKCGYGLCGSCRIGKYTVCIDGPVFTYKEMQDVPDFGKFKIDRSGRKEFM